MSATQEATDTVANPTYTAMIERFKEISQLGHIVELLHWDQEVMMPTGGAGRRAEDTATLQKLIHQQTVSPRLQELVSELSSAKESLSALQQANVREAEKTVKRAVKVPDTLVAAIAKHEVISTQRWLEARKEKDYGLFQPHLEEMLKLKCEYADAVREDQPRYDALLDLYEPNGTAADLEQQFSALRPELVKLLDKIKGSHHPTDHSALKGDFPEDKQEAFCKAVIEKMGFSFDEGRLDRSTHPFCSGGGSDVRITTRYAANSLDESLFGCMHEAGHGLYEQGLNRDRLDTPAGGYASLGVHESQSRLWENNIGRSKAFWQHLYPTLQSHFPVPFSALSMEEYWRGINHVTPSLIRTESDEVTYNLHIILRFDFERALLEGSLDTKDLKDAWNARYQKDFGITPPDDTKGCLQDIHWAAGLIGYFPTYTLGNLYAAQITEAIDRDLGLEALLQEGDLSPIADWLRTNIHAHGRTYPATELIERATGKAPSAVPFVAYLNDKFNEIYKLS